MSTKSLTHISNQRYLNLETYRKSGVPVATPLWFAEEKGRLYVYSRANAGKVKRLRNNPRVRIVPCNMYGKPNGEWVEAKARILNQQEAPVGHKLLNKKYGWMKKIADALSKLRNKQKVVIAIELV